MFIRINEIITNINSSLLPTVEFHKKESPGHRRLEYWPHHKRLLSTENPPSFDTQQRPVVNCQIDEIHLQYHPRHKRDKSSAVVRQNKMAGAKQNCAGHWRNWAFSCLFFFVGFFFFCFFPPTPAIVLTYRADAKVERCGTDGRC